MDWHTLPIQTVLEELISDPNKGLTGDEVFDRQIKNGKNTLPEERRTSLWKVFFRQFMSPLIYLLMFAALAAFLMGEYSDAVVILSVVTLNAIIGALQEGRAERSLADLKKLSTIKARTLRNGHETTIVAAELVPGDIVLFNSGDAIPADMRVIDGHSLAASEATLTGESAPVEKNNDVLEVTASLGDRKNMLYSGTFITAGRAKAVVVATGIKTEVGKIAALTGAVTEPMTPLNVKVNQFSKYLMLAAAIMFCLLVLLGWWQGIPFKEIIMVAISQVVGMVPEGLPVAMTVAAAVGVQRMASRKTIVRRLSAVETLGSTSVICSDKTGTITLNEMSVREVCFLPRRKIDFEAKVVPDDELTRLMMMSLLCNDAQLDGEKKMGDPTEWALIVAAEKLGLSKVKCDETYPRINEIPFDSAIKMMATEHRSLQGEHFIAVKGAVDRVLEYCENNDQIQKQVQDMNDELASKALRVIAIAHAPEVSLDKKIEELRGKLKFLGLVGQMDPPRMEVSRSIEDCRSAGIHAIMITGDHKITGLAIAKMVGLAREGDLALDGNELEALSDEDLDKVLERVAVFARVHPSQKLRIVDVLQKRGHVVAMTGDGVNDAPALGKADVGVAMGITGTEVAKEASKIIITDDNFTTIVSAIAEGRLVFQNIKKVILLLFSTSIAEVIVLFAGLLVGLPPPFTAVQILWNNLVTEGVITVNLIMEPAEGNEMRHRPISRDEPIINKVMRFRMLFIVPTIILCTFGWYYWRMGQGIELAKARTETFTLLAICEWFNVLNCRSETKSALNLDLFKNKWLLGGLLVGNLLHILVVFWRPLGKYFHTVPIDLDIVVTIIIIGSLVLWVEEVRKFYDRRRKGSPE